MLRQVAQRAARQVRGLYAPHMTVRAFAADAAPATNEDAWAKVNEVVASDEGKRAIAQLQKTMGDIRDAVAREAQPLPPVDWSGIKAKSGFPEIVDQFKAGLDGVKYPKYDGKEIEETAAEFKKLVAEAQKVATEAEARLVEIDAELAQIQADKTKLSTITMDEVFEQEPKLKEEVEERIRNGVWY